MSKRRSDIEAGAEKLHALSIHGIEDSMGPQQQHIRPRQELEDLALRLRRDDGALNRAEMENRAKIDPEYLTPYLDQWVAWSPDGT